VLLGNAQADYEAALGIAAIEQRADRFEKWARAEQWLEAGRRIRVVHFAIIAPNSVSAR
jgi:hypothetical protein